MKSLFSLIAIWFCNLVDEIAYQCLEVFLEELFTLLQNTEKFREMLMSKSKLLTRPVDAGEETKYQWSLKLLIF